MGTGNNQLHYPSEAVPKCSSQGLEVWVVFCFVLFCFVFCDLGFSHDADKC